jgi:hypothetical protein
MRWVLPVRCYLEATLVPKIVETGTYIIRYTTRGTILTGNDIGTSFDRARVFLWTHDGGGLGNEGIEAYTMSGFELPVTRLDLE